MWLMSRLHLKAGVPQLMDGVREHGAAKRQWLEQRVHSALFRLAQMRTSATQESQEQRLSERFLYPAMKMLVYEVYKALVLLAQFLSRVQQRFLPLVLQAPERLAQFQSRLMQALRSLVSLVRGHWVRLRSRARRQSVSQAWQEQQGLEASQQSQATLFLFQWMPSRDILAQLRSMAMRMWSRQAWKRPVQRVALMSGDLSMTVKHRIGQVLMTARHQIGQLSTTVKHRIGKR